MNKIMVSVIIPTYNRSNLIRDALFSVINQTYKNLEIIVVDDCSTDDTEDVVSDFIKNDVRISYLKTDKNSGGPALPKNIGIKNSSGKYIAVLDSDDEWMLDKLERQLELFTEKIKVVGCGYLQNGINHIISSKNIKRVLIKDFLGPGSCMMYDRKIFGDVGMFDEKLKSGQDWDMRIRILESGKSFAFVKAPLVKYEINSDSVSARDKRRLNADLRKIFFKHRRFLLINFHYGIIHLFYLLIRSMLPYLNFKKRM